MEIQLGSAEPKPTGVTWRFKVLYQRHLELLEEEKMIENNTVTTAHKEKFWKQQTSKNLKKTLRSISGTSSNQSSHWASGASNTSYTITSLGDTTRSIPSTFHSNNPLSTRGLIHHKHHFGLDQEILASA